MCFLTRSSSLAYCFSKSISHCSSWIGTPAFCALASLEPGSSPTTRCVSDLLTPLAMVPPRCVIASSAAERVILLRRPVSKKVCPDSGPLTVCCSSFMLRPAYATARSGHDLALVAASYKDYGQFLDQFLVSR